MLKIQVYVCAGDISMQCSKHLHNKDFVLLSTKQEIIKW